jgi:hypothetical protein
MLNSTRESWSQIALGDQNFYEKKGFFAWWYRFTSPPDPALGATFQQRDLVRRGRIASACMLFLAIILVFVAFIAYLGPNKQIATIIYTLYPMIIICIFLNRQGKVNLVGILMTLALVGGMCLTLFTTAAGPGLGPNDKDILYLLFFAELFVAAILPINYVFLVAAINIGISVYMLTYAHHTPALNAVLAIGYASTLFRLMQIHVIVTGVLWILVNNSRIAIKRADRAEEMARLQRDLAQLSQEKAGEQEALEHSINLITETHARVSNGDLNARVAIDTGNTFMLWQIAGPLNNLLARYQNLRMEMQQREQLIQVFQQLMQANPELARVVSIEMQRMHSPHSGWVRQTNPYS